MSENLTLAGNIIVYNTNLGRAGVMCVRKGNTPAAHE